MSRACVVKGGRERKDQPRLSLPESQVLCLAYSLCVNSVNPPKDMESCCSIFQVRKLRPRKAQCLSKVTQPVGLLCIQSQSCCFLRGTGTEMCKNNLSPAPVAAECPGTRVRFMPSISVPVLPGLGRNVKNCSVQTPP